MCGVEPKPQQNAIVGVCIALAVVVIGLVGMSYAITQSYENNIHKLNGVTQLDDGDMFEELGTGFFPCLAGGVFLLAVLSWAMLHYGPEEEQTFDPPV